MKGIFVAVLHLCTINDGTFLVFSKQLFVMEGIAAFYSQVGGDSVALLRKFSVAGHPTGGGQSPLIPHPTPSSIPAQVWVSHFYN